MNAATARRRLAEVGGSAQHEARHVAAAMLLGVPVVEASAIPQIDGDEVLSLGHVNLGPESWTYEDVYNRALVTLVGDLGDRDDWPPPHPSDASMHGKAPARLGNDGDRLWKAIEALGLDELEYDLLVREARGLVKRRDFRRLEVGVSHLLEQGHTVGPELLERVREITRQETKATPASTKLGADAGWFAALADMRGADSDRIATGAFDRTIKRWQESGEQIPLQWRDTPSFAYQVRSVDPATLRDEDAFGPLFEGSIDLDGEHRAEARHAWTAIKGNAVALELDYMVLASDEHDDTRTLEQLDITGLTLTPTSEANELIHQADAADLRELRRESDRVRIEIALAGIDRTPRPNRSPRSSPRPPWPSCVGRPPSAASGSRRPTQSASGSSAGIGRVDGDRHLPSQGHEREREPAQAGKHGRGAACRQGGPTVTDARRRPSPYRLIVSDDPCKTLAQGEMRHFARLIDAANAFAKSDAPFKTVVYDDGCEARDLNRNEQWMLETVCGMLGYDVEDYRAEAAG